MASDRNTRTIEIKGLDALLKRLDEHGRMDEPVFRPLHDAVSQIVQDIEARAKDNLTPQNVAFGHLRASIGSQVKIDEASIVGEAGTSLGNPASANKVKGYAEVVEFGSRPHWAPLQPLIEWVEVKRLAGVYSLKTQRRLGNKADRQAQNEALARMIQFKIRHHGTRPHPYFFPAVDAALPDAERLLEDAIDQVVKNF